MCVGWLQTAYIFAGNVHCFIWIISEHWYCWDCRLWYWFYRLFNDRKRTGSAWLPSLWAWLSFPASMWKYMVWKIRHYVLMTAKSQSSSILFNLLWKAHRLYWNRKMVMKHRGKETIPALLSFCGAIHTLAVYCSDKVPEIRNVDVFYVVCLNNLMNKQLSCRWFETHYCLSDVIVRVCNKHSIFHKLSNW